MANLVTRAKQTFVSSLAFLMTSLPVASQAADQFDGSFWFKQQGGAPSRVYDDRNDGRGQQYRREEARYPYQPRYNERPQPRDRFYSRYNVRHSVTPRVMRTDVKGMCVVQNYDFWGNPEQLITVPCREARHYVVHRRHIPLPIHIRGYHQSRYHRGPDVRVRAAGGLRGGYIWKDGKRHYPIVKKKHVQYKTYDNRRRDKTKTYYGLH
jgi:hypothetical protein